MMASAYEENQLPRRSRSSIDALPSAIRAQFNYELERNELTYVEMSEWLKSEGYEISKSAIGRYARKTSKTEARVMESLNTTERLARMVEAHPDMDYTKAASVVLMDGLMRRVSEAEDEFDLMPLDKAGRLIAALSRNATYEKRVRADLKKKAELAFDELQADLMSQIKQYPELVEPLRGILVRAREKVVDANAED